MHQYLNEDVAFERLKDLQREAENRRLAAAGPPRDLGLGIRRLFARAAGLLRRAAPAPGERLNARLAFGAKNAECALDSAPLAPKVRNSVGD